jgi:hypothetical protein
LIMIPKTPGFLVYIICFMFIGVAFVVFLVSFASNFLWKA